MQQVLRKWDLVWDDIEMCTFVQFKGVIGNLPGPEEKRKMRARKKQKTKGNI
jgi:hypothetical protein